MMFNRYMVYQDSILLVAGYAIAWILAGIIAFLLIEWACEKRK